MSPNRQATAALVRPNPFAALFQEIAEMAQAALRRSSYFELHDVSCDFSGGILTLRGCVPTYHLKQIAQASVADVPGVVEVHNRVEVVSPRLSENVGWRGRKSLLSADVG
jgi:osmotically-inducible protein OsmY